MRSPILKFLTPDEISAIISKTKAAPGDIIFLARTKKSWSMVLGKLRDKLEESLDLKDPNIIARAWIVGFPMYEYNETLKVVDFAITLLVCLKVG